MIVGGTRGTNLDTRVLEVRRMSGSIFFSLGLPNFVLRNRHFQTCVASIGVDV